METLSNLINESLKLFDNFETNLNLPKNYDTILETVEKIELNLKKYNTETYFSDINNLNETEREDIKNSLKKLILKIQKMNGFADAKANLNNKFNNYTT